MRCPVRGGHDLHGHPVVAVLHRVVRLIRRDAVGGDQGTVEDDEPLRRQFAQRGIERGGVLGQEVGGLGHIPGGDRGGAPESGCHLGERSVRAQVHRDQQSLVEAAQPAPTRAQFTPSGVDQPGNVLDDLVRDVEHGSIRDRQGSCVETLASEITSATTRSPATLRTPTAGRRHL